MLSAWFEACSQVDETAQHPPRLKRSVVCCTIYCPSAESNSSDQVAVSARTSSVNSLLSYSLGHSSLPPISSGKFLRGTDWAQNYHLDDEYLNSIIYLFNQSNKIRQ